LQKYVLNISVEASELIFTLEGSGVKSTKVSELTIESARTLTTMYYGSEGSEFSEESLLIGQEIEDRYLSSGEVKHHAFLFPVWYKAVGQYIYDNLLPHEISELINKIPNESIIKLELDDRTIQSSLGVNV